LLNRGQIAAQFTDTKLIYTLQKVKANTSETSSDVADSYPSAKANEYGVDNKHRAIYQTLIMGIIITPIAAQFQWMNVVQKFSQKCLFCSYKKVALFCQSTMEDYIPQI